MYNSLMSVHTNVRSYLKLEFLIFEIQIKVIIHYLLLSQSLVYKHIFNNKKFKIKIEIFEKGVLLGE